MAVISIKQLFRSWLAPYLVSIKDYVDTASGGGSKNVYFDSFWAEESGNFSSATSAGYQFSYGNGETGASGGFGIPVPSGYKAEIVKITFTSKGTSTGVIDLVINRTLQGLNIAVSATANESSSYDLASPIEVNDADKITFRTVSVTAASDGNLPLILVKFTEL